MMTLMTKAVAGWRYFRDVLVKRDEKSRYVLAEALARQVYPRYKFSEFGRLIEYDEDFIRFYEKFCGTDNYHSLDRKYTLDQLMKLVTDIEGDTVECGVWRGASSYLMCRRIVGLRKTHHIFDSFEGLSKPGRADGSHWTEGAWLVTSLSFGGTCTNLISSRIARAGYPNGFTKCPTSGFALSIWMWTFSSPRSMP